MKTTLTTLAIVAGSQALVPRAEPCCFSINAQGGRGGLVSQLGDGQNRIGDTRLPPGEYCIQPDGSLTDGHGRGCILTPPTTQWQCDAGAKGTPGFSIASNGSVVYSGSTTFYSCPTEDHEGWNIYSKPLANEHKCVPIQLMANGCYAAPSMSTPGSSTASSTTVSGSVSRSQTSSNVRASTSTSAAPSTAPQGSTSSSTPATQSSVASSTISTPTGSSSRPAQTTSSAASAASSTSAPAPPTQSKQSVSSTAPATHSSAASSASRTSQPAPSKTATPSIPALPTSSKSQCPMDLPRHFEFPHLIVHVDKEAKATAFGNSLNGTVSSTMSSIFNFDIPAALKGHDCTIHFLWPEQSQLETSAYEFLNKDGDDKFTFSLLEAPASEDTTYSTVPKKEQDLGSYHMFPGNAYHLAKRECPAGETIAIQMAANAGYFNYFQDFNPCPIGLYITSNWN